MVKSKSASFSTEEKLSFKSLECVMAPVHYVLIFCFQWRNYSSVMDFSMFEKYKTASVEKISAGLTHIN